MKKPVLLFLTLILTACASSSAPQATVTPEAIVTLTPTLEAPIPVLGVEMPEIESHGFADDELAEKLHTYADLPLYSYDSSGKPIILEGMDKPTGKAAFSVDGAEYVVAFGVNGESWVMHKDGERYVAMEYDNLRLPDGTPIENAVGYHLYIDPDTRGIADEIDAKTWRIPAFSILTDPETGASLLLRYNYQDLLLGDKGFKQVVKDGAKADVMLSLVSPELLKDIQSAPKFVSEIDFEGDWKVVFDQDGNIIMIDVASEEELGKYEKGKWVEAISPGMKQLNEAVDNLVKMIETFAVGESDGTSIILTDKESGEIKYNFLIGENYELTDPETGEVVYRDGRWDLSYARTMIGESGSCKVTEWVGNKGENPGHASPSSDRSDYSNQYAKPLMEYYSLRVKNRSLPSYGLYAYINEYLGNGCWGIVPNASEEQKESIMLWKDQDGRPKYLDIFMTSIDE